MAAGAAAARRYRSACDADELAHLATMEVKHKAAPFPPPGHWLQTGRHHQSRSRGIADGLHQAFPLAAVGTDPVSVKLPRGEMGHLVAEHFFDERPLRLLEIGGDTHRASARVANAKTAGHPPAPLDGAAAFELRHAPDAGPARRRKRKLREEVPLRLSAHELDPNMA